MPDDDSIEANVSALLVKIREGSEEAKNELFRVVNDRLREMANRLKANNAKDLLSFQASALIGEAFEKLDEKGVIASAEDRRYLFGAFNKKMRWLLIDHVRKSKRQKIGGDREKQPLDVVIGQFESQNDVPFDALHEALESLGKEAPRQKEIVELRFFSGLKMDAIADLLGVSKSTVESDWRLARAKLHSMLKD